MAKRIITTTEFTDDLTGGKAEGTIGFALEGKNYEIDLNKSNANALRKALKPYIEVARTVRGSGKGRVRTGASGSGRSDLDAIRTWARKNKLHVADRGRIAASVIEAYDAAN
jgi:hypothetical protein